MAAITRLGSGGYPMSLNGSFAGKVQGATASQGLVTRIIIRYTLAASLVMWFIFSAE